MMTIEEAAKFHGHICPGLALGYRVSLAALKALGKRSEDEELVAIVENDSCAVDAVQVMTGCTFGKGNLIFHDYGKQVYTFIRRPSGEAIRIAINWEPQAESAKQQAAWKAYASGDRSAPVLAMVHECKGLKTASIISAPDEELLSITKVDIAMPHTARIHPSVKCARCGEKTMETRLGIRRGETLCIPCTEEADKQ